MLRSLYDWTLKKAEHPKALWILALLSFAESSFFPIPPDVLVIPMVLAAPTRAWRIALVCSVASVLGGMFGYYIGFALYETIGQPIIDFYHMQAQYERFTPCIMNMAPGLSPWPVSPPSPTRFSPSPVAWRILTLPPLSSPAPCPAAPVSFWWQLSYGNMVSRSGILSKKDWGF